MNIKRLFRLVFIILSLLILPNKIYSQENVNFTILNLNEAIKTAFGSNKLIQIQEKEIKTAKARILGAKSFFYPHINASSSYAYNEQVLDISSIPIELKKDIGVFTGFKNDNLLGANVTQSIYSGNSNTSRLKQSKIYLLVQQETLRAIKLDIEFEIKRLYYGLILALETMNIAQDLYDQTYKHYIDTKAKFDQGIVSKFDVLQSKVQISKVLPELIRSKNSVSLIKAELNKSMGKDVGEDMKPANEIEYNPIKITEVEFLKKALANKPEMKLKSYGIDIFKWQVELAKAGDRPKIDASLNYYYRSNDFTDMVNSRHRNFSAGILVTMPIFGGFSTKAKVDEAKARYEKANLEQEEMENQIAIDVRRACLDLSEAESIIFSQKDSVELAREALRLAEVKYENGEGTNLEVLDSQVTLSQIQKNLSEGIYDYIMAKAFLDRTLAEFTVKEEFNENKK